MKIREWMMSLFRKPDLSPPDPIHYGMVNGRICRVAEAEAVVSVIGGQAAFLQAEKDWNRKREGVGDGR